MAPTSLLPTVSLALLAILALTSPAPANALSLQQTSNNVVRSHSNVARSLNGKRATNAKRCKPRSSSSSAAPSSTKKATTTSTSSTQKAAVTTTTKAAPAKTTAKATTSNSGSSGSSSGGSSSSGSNSGVNLRGKSCLAWPNYNYNDLSTWKGSKTGLIYSWDATKVPDAEELGFTYAPMLWGWKNADDFKSKAVEGYATIALGPNEPNETGQSNMDAQSGIQIWREYMLPLASKGYTLISPAMSSRPNGKDWMAEFMKDCGRRLCRECHISGIATHYYGTDLEEFKTYVQYWYDTYKLPVYITEYADQDFNGGPQASMDEIWTFMEGATTFFNENDWVKAHCWFGAMTGMDNVNPLNTLMNSAGTAPNDLGYYFINN
ncbi:glycosyl hydrolase catalytic core-domain-containing protein [Mycena metata]|uniref:Glycosyl hydrolase catalytic core-domain-containing protein n=1 Tax=Mycena metata TaxID=1033252 RepID=A0AAD7KEE4_9AGAR|nr:glycosyl hydrolase catalytic core-domain-containing protein [Mycena metata]